MKSDTDQTVREILSGYVPERREIEPNWAAVVERARLLGPEQARRAGRRPSRRALIIAFAALLVLVGSALAIGETIDLLSAGHPPEYGLPEAGGSPNSGPQGFPTQNPDQSVGTVATGNWDGQDWYIFAYRSVSNEACYGIERGEPSSFWSFLYDLEYRPGFACASMGEDNRLIHPLQFIYSPSSDGHIPPDAKEFAPFLMGPVGDQIASVRVERPSGDPIELKTVPIPEAAGIRGRFFYVRLPADVQVSRVAALDADGKTVAELGPGESPSPPSQAERASGLHR